MIKVDQKSMKMLQVYRIVKLLVIEVDQKWTCCRSIEWWRRWGSRLIRTKWRCCGSTEWWRCRCSRSIRSKWRCCRPREWWRSWWSRLIRTKWRCYRSREWWRFCRSRERWRCFIILKTRIPNRSVVGRWSEWRVYLWSLITSSMILVLENVQQNFA